MRQITLEEYQDAIEILDGIKLEKEALVADEIALNKLLLQIKRKNEQLDREINLEIKMLLAPYDLSKNIYDYLRDYLDSLVYQLLSSSIPEETLPIFLTALPNFNCFLNKVTRLTALKKENLNLQENILTLCQKEQMAFTVKNNYERQRKRNYRFYIRKK